MSKIILFGKEVFVDKEDVDLLQDSVWHLDKDNYVVRNKRNAPKGFHYRLHRLILDAPSGKLVDHRKKLNTNNTSGYRGVRKIGNRYYAYIKENGRQRGLGGYPTPEEASAVYEQELGKLDPVGCARGW